MPERKDSADETAVVPETIRVRLLDNDFLHEYHGQVTVTCGESYTVYDTGGGTPEGALTRECAAGERLEVDAEVLAEGRILRVEGSGGAPLLLESLKRAGGTPQYAGKLYLIGSAQGIAVVNEVSLEEYLCSVVSSEMPSDYPAEAQKAQAVCARTYAVNCINGRESGPYQEHLNDSVSFQVYNNYGSSEASRQAVEDTKGEILPLDEVQYYSTSCLSEHREDLDSDASFAQFLSEEPSIQDEYGSPWLRWSTQVPVGTVLKNLQEMYGEEILAVTENANGAAGSGQNSGSTEAPGNGSTDVPALSLRIDERRGDGQVTALSVVCGGRTLQVEGEYRIRKLLGGRELELSLLDGTVTKGMQLLPSAFFCLEGGGDGAAFSAGGSGAAASAESAGGTYAYPLGGNICIYGGGYGHGNGMSQCGAAQMASKGLDYAAILEYYYEVNIVRGSAQ